MARPQEVLAQLAQPSDVAITDDTFFSDNFFNTLSPSSEKLQINTPTSLLFKHMLRVDGVQLGDETTAYLEEAETILKGLAAVDRQEITVLPKDTRLERLLWGFDQFIFDKDWNRLGHHVPLVNDFGRFVVVRALGDLGQTVSEAP